MLHLSLALGPVFIILLFIYFQDKYDKEPVKTLLISLLLGIVSVVPAIIIELFYEYAFNFANTSNNIVSFLYAFLGVGLTEEACKFIVLFLFIYKNKNFTEPLDGIVYAVFVSLGFAAIENVGYVISSDDPVFTAFSRSLTAVPAHATFGVFMGYYFGIARFTYKFKRPKLLALAVIVPAIAHGFYNAFLFIDCLYCPIVSLIFLVFFIVLSLRIISRYQKLSPFKKKHKFLGIKQRVISAEERAEIEERKRNLKFKHRFKLFLKKVKKKDN